MYIPPKLDRDQLRVLEAIDQRGVVRGRDLVRFAGFEKPAQLLDAVGVLLQNELIDVSGDAYDEKGILSAVFSTRPSANTAVKYALS